MTNGLKPYPAYKDSGVPWLGQVPEQWESNRLGHVSTLMVPMRDKPEDLTGPIPWIRIEDFNGRSIASSQSGQGVSADTIRAMNLKVFPVGTVLCSCSCSMGTAAIAARPIVTNQTFIGIVPGVTFSSEYLFYLLQAAKDYLTQIATGAIQTYLSRSEFSSLGIVVPPLIEQRAIVRYLDHADRNVRRGIRARQQLVKLLTEQKQATIQRAVTRGLDPNVRLKPSGIPWLGDVPEHWEVSRLKYLCRFAYGNSLPSEIRQDGGIPVFGSNGRVGLHSVANTRAPCIVVGRKGSFGKVNFSETPVFAIDTTYYVDERFTHANLRWLSYLLASLGLDGVSKDSAIPGLDRGDVYDQVVSYPIDTREQALIVQYIDAATAYLDKAIDVAHREIDLLREYRTRLIADVVTGKLDVRDVTVPDDETDVLPEELESIDDVDTVDQTDDVTEGNSESSAEETA